MNEYLKVVFTADTKKFLTGLNRVSAEMKRVGQGMESFGRTMSMRVTAPIVAFGVASVKAFGDQEKAEFKLRAALQANGREVNKLFDDYKAFASGLQDVTVVGDETSLAMLQVAENMGLTGESAKRAVRNAIGLSSAFGIATQSAMRYTAMLEQGDTTMLNRYIPTLRGIEDETERVAAAQQILSNGFQTALAEADTFSGQMQQLTNNFGDFQEVVGQVVAESLLPFTDTLNRMTLELKALSPEQIRSKVEFAAIAAAIPLVTIAVGSLIKSVGVITPLLKSLFLLIRAHPIGALATAMGVLSIKALAVARDVRKLRDDYEDLTTLGEEDFGNRELARLDLLIADLTQRLLDFSYAGATTESGIEALRGQYALLEDQLATLIELRAQLAFPVRTATEALPGEIIPDAPIRPRIQVLPPDEGVDVTPIEQGIQEALDGVDFGFPANSIGFMNDQIALLQQKMLSATDPTTIIQYQQAIEQLQQRIADLTDTSVELEEVSFSLSAIFDRFGESIANMFAQAIVEAKSFADVLKQIGKMILSTGLQLLIRGFLMGGLGGGGFLGSGGGLFSMLGITKVNDALITSAGDVIKFHPDDNILAMKDLSMLGGGQSVNVVVTGQLRGEDIFLSGTRGGARFNR